jgi:hypothetical protein
MKRPDASLRISGERKTPGLTSRGRLGSTAGCIDNELQPDPSSEHCMTQTLSIDRIQTFRSAFARASKRKRRPGKLIMLRQKARVVRKSR